MKQKLKSADLNGETSAKKTVKELEKERIEADKKWEEIQKQEKVTSLMLTLQSSKSRGVCLLMFKIKRDSFIDFTRCILCRSSGRIKNQNIANITCSLCFFGCFHSPFSDRDTLSLWKASLSKYEHICLIASGILEKRNSPIWIWNTSSFSYLQVQIHLFMLSSYLCKNTLIFAPKYSSPNFTCCMQNDITTVLFCLSHHCKKIYLYNTPLFYYWLHASREKSGTCKVASLLLTK